jgi:prephenate dehydratase
VLAADIEDRPDNQTRFLVVRAPGSRASPFEAGPVRCGDAMKLLLVAETRNVPGALVGVLRPFADRQINLSRLEARPGAEPWSYRFFVEVEACAGAEATRAALAEVGERTESLRVLGGFPRWG